MLDLADYRSTPLAQPAHSQDCQPDYAFWNLAPIPDTADLVPVADMLAAGLADSTQIAFED
jgi:hypothetical protein